MAHAPITLPSPVSGIIHEQSWTRPANNFDFRLASTAAQHVARGSAPSIDLGNGHANLPPVMSIIAGKVVEHRIADGVTTIQSFDGNWRVVNAHMAIDAAWKATPLGSSVGVGAVIGHMSNTSPAAIRAHWHGQVGFKVVNNKGWLDPWPLLAINQFAVVNGPSINIRTGPSKAAPIFATSRADGIKRAGVKIAELTARMKVLQPPFAVGDGLVWVRANLNGQVVFISKALVHFDV
jgi:hypothetical protein